MLIKKEMIVNIITVKAVRNIPICIKSLSVMYTASPPFKVQRTSGDELTAYRPRFPSKQIISCKVCVCQISLENVLTLF